MAESQPGAADARVRWDDSKARRAHANECAVSLGRDRVVVSFGVSQAPQAGEPDRIIEVTREVAMMPYVAKQLAVLLDRVLREYESRYGEGRRTGTPPAKEEDSIGTV